MFKLVFKLCLETLIFESIVEFHLFVPESSEHSWVDGPYCYGFACRINITESLVGLPKYVRWVLSDIPWCPLAQLADGE